jgi:tripartite-type tricarboxylate transporter receptor subunit TctC
METIIMRSLLSRVMAVAIGVLSLCQSAAAQSAYPERPVRLVVPYAAGGPTDAFARALADSWGRRLGATIVVENRTGAGTLVGTEGVARSAPDGYTVLLTTVAHAVNQSIHAKLPYRTVEDFAPVGLAARAPLVLVVNKDVPAKTLQEFMTYLKTKPGKASYGSAGIGSAPHLASELLNYMAGLQAIHVPYRGSAPAMTDLIGGRVEFMIDSAPTGLAQVKAGSVRLLATSMAQRLPQTPNTPAIAEVVPGYESYTWNAAFVPAGTPAAVVGKLAATLREALQDEGLKRKAYDMGLLLESNPTPDALGRFLKAELQKWGKVAQAAKITAN